ncbi:MAG: hypothetical protein Q8N23_11740 [Archangium sp.]|nr:hypothetical protein [Archangium sp.]MDP3153338.1 hypothetical protein [Archangium sp.]MDP3573404.1 hypothetical protein [Archangium sp.]
MKTNQSSFSVRLLTLTVGALLALGSGCSTPPVTCGLGTVFDSAHNECVKAPDLNIIVEDFNLGEFEMTQVDVPESLQVGSPQTRSFKIKNAGTTHRELVLIRYAVSPVQATIQELRARLDNLDDDTELGGAFLGQVVIRDLAPGEQRTVEYYLSAPSSLSDGLYGFFFAVDEVPLQRISDTEYRLDYSAPGMAGADGTLRLDDAALVFAPATVIIGTPAQPNLRVLFSSLDNASFLLDRSERGVERAFTMSARMSAQALNITEPVTATFELELPGHKVQTPGKDLGEAWFTAHGQDFAAAPDATSYVYDAARKFSLLAETENGPQPQVRYSADCRPGTPTAADDDGGTEDPVVPDECATIFNDDGRDAVYQLHLSAEDTRLLAMTRRLASLNPGLDANGEVAGTLVYRLSTTQAEYQNNLADNVARKPVVFMAPADSSTAAETDVDDQGATGSMSDLTSPYPFVLRDDSLANGFGNDWFGASFRNSSLASVDKRQGVAVAQFRKATASVDGMVLKQNLRVLTLGAQVDWSTLRLHNTWSASANINVWGYTLLNAQFSPTWCTKDGDITYCPLFEAEPSASPRNEATKTANNQPKDKKKTGRQVKWEKEFFFMAGPVPLTIEASAGFSSGMTFSGKFLIDETGKTSGRAPFYGVEFAAGPYIALEASVFGGVSVGMARAGVQGSLTIVRLDFTPLIRPKARLEYDANAGCFKHAEFGIDYEGPITLTGPSGTVSIVAYVGRKICVWKCWKVEVKVLDLTIARFSSASQTWFAWKESTAWSKKAGESGMCAGATAAGPAVWRSPTSCAGGYCNATSSNPNRWSSAPAMGNVLAAYKTTFDTAGAGKICASVTVSGLTEPWYDRVVIYNAAGQVMNTSPSGSGWTGDINQQMTVCSPNVTVALETDGSVTRSGVTVTIAPIP